jgi:hypothetical protein
MWRKPVGDGAKRVMTVSVMAAVASVRGSEKAAPV